MFKERDKIYIFNWMPILMGLVDRVVNEWKNLDNVTRFIVDLGRWKVELSDSEEYCFKELQGPFDTTSTYSERIVDTLTWVAYLATHPIKWHQACRYHSKDQCKSE